VRRARRCVDEGNRLIDELATADDPVQRILQHAWYTVGVLRARDQDRVALLQRGPKPGDWRRRRTALEIRIEGRKRLELAVDRDVRSIWRETGDGFDERTVRRGSSKAPRNRKDTDAVSRVHEPQTRWSLEIFLWPGSSSHRGIIDGVP